MAAVTSATLGFVIEIECGRIPPGAGAAITFLTGGAGEVFTGAGVGVTGFVTSTAGASSNGLSETTVIFLMGIGSSSISKLFFFRHSVDTTE